MRFGVATALVAGLASTAHADTIRCDTLATADLTIDGLLDDWKQTSVAARTGAAPDGAVALRCAWDGTALALALDITDDRVVRVAGGRGHEDYVDIALTAAGDTRPVVLRGYPGNAIAKAKLVAPPRVELADSLQPHGFSLEARVPVSAIHAFSASTPSLALRVVFHDSDAAAGGSERDLPIVGTIELSDRKDLLDDFLSATGLHRADIKLDTLAELDPDRKGKERLVAGGTVVGVLTDQFAYVTLPVAKPADVRGVALLPVGPCDLQLVSAVVRQYGNGGSRDLLLVWTVWSGQLSPVAQIEVRKQEGDRVLECDYKIARGAHGSELLVTPKPPIGWTAETWNEEPASDADAIVLPWDTRISGEAYTLTGKSLTRRDVARKKTR